MGKSKLKISDVKFDINLKFYFFLKYLVKSQLTNGQVSKTFEICGNEDATWENKVENIFKQIEMIKGEPKKNSYFAVIEMIESKEDLDLFVFSLRLYAIKDLLLEDAKFKKTIIGERLAKLHPLSLEYDKISVFDPYSVRVNGALLALLFFEKLEKGKSDFMSSDVELFLSDLSKDAIRLKKKGIEPNQIFMLMFNESVKSITSDSGSNYEDRITTVLTKIGINPEDISKKHDEEDASTEYDFFFYLQGKSYGISAKRTLRERYKQFIKTAHTGRIDIMIEITIGLDLNKTKAETIRSHGVYIFVSDEVYTQREDLKLLDGIFPVSQLTMETLLLLT